MQVANFCPKYGGGWAFPWRNLGSVFARSKQRARSRLPLSPIYEGSCGHKKEPQAIYALGFGSLLPQSGFFSWAAGVGGWGAAQLGLIRPHLAVYRAYSMPCGVIEHDDRRRIAEHLARVDHRADRHRAGRVSQRTISEDLRNLEVTSKIGSRGRGSHKEGSTGGRGGASRTRSAIVALSYSGKRKTPTGRGWN
jgi:hypothetical protein